MLGKPIKPIEVIQYLKNEVASLATEIDGLSYQLSATQEQLKSSLDREEYSKHLYDNMLSQIGDLISRFTDKPCTGTEASVHTIQQIYDKAKKHFGPWPMDISESLKGVYKTSQGWATAVSLNDMATPSILTGQITSSQNISVSASPVPTAISNGPVTTPANTPQGSGVMKTYDPNGIQTTSGAVGNVKSQASPLHAVNMGYLQSKITVNAYKEPEWIKDTMFPNLEYRDWGNHCVETRWSYKKD